MNEIELNFIQTQLHTWAPRNGPRVPGKATYLSPRKGNLLELQERKLPWAPGKETYLSSRKGNQVSRTWSRVPTVEKVAAVAQQVISCALHYFYHQIIIIILWTQLLEVNTVDKVLPFEFKRIVLLKVVNFLSALRPYVPTLGIGGILEFLHKEWWITDLTYLLTLMPKQKTKR